MSCNRQDVSSECVCGRVRVRTEAAEESRFYRKQRAEKYIQIFWFSIFRSGSLPTPLMILLRLPNKLVVHAYLTLVSTLLPHNPFPSSPASTLFLKPVSPLY